MTQTSASKYQEQCLALLDQVGPEGVLITKRGKPVAKLVAVESGFKSLIGTLKGRIRIRGDINSSGIDWRATSRS